MGSQYPLICHLSSGLFHYYDRLARHQIIVINKLRMYIICYNLKKYNGCQYPPISSLEKYPTIQW